MSSPLPSLDSIFIPASIPTREELEAMHLRAIERARSNPTCFTRWFPVVERLTIPHPRSVVIDFPDSVTMALLEDRPFDVADDLSAIAAKIMAFGEEVGYPLFIKNSLFSGKHDWPNTCYIAPGATEEAIIGQIINLTNFWACVGCELALHLVAREFIQTAPVFHAFGGMPVTAEFRLFATDGELNGWQPYWPERAIQAPDTENWQELLASISTPGDEEMNQMRAWAEAVTRELGGFWSVDFLRGRDGKLWLIDMAEGHKSYHCEKGYRAVTGD